MAIYDDRISEDAILQFKSNNKIKGRRHALIDCGCGPNTSEPISPCQAMWGKELWPNADFQHCESSTVSPSPGFGRDLVENNSIESAQTESK